MQTGAMLSRQSGNRRGMCVGMIACLGLLANWAALASADEGARDMSDGAYVVLASKRTWDDRHWRPVIEKLRAQHDACLIVADSPGAALPAMARFMPRYVCWVAMPEELGRKAVVEAHRAMRRLDDDPYTDAIWGIITGYEAADAMRVVSRDEPLVVRRVLSGTSGTDLNAYDEGIRFSEGRAGGRWVKRDGGQVVFDEDFPADSTKGHVDALNNFGPDVFITSGHATERDWQIGYSYKDGQLRCADGQLFGVDTEGRRHDVNSPNSKVFLGVGNCLIGNIPDRDCMALAMIRSAGFDQFYGYTAVTFFGYMGWGVRDYFDAQAGRFTLAESAFAVNQALLHELLSKYPDKAGIDFEHYDQHRMGALFNGHGLGDRRLIGLLWDRDVMAFYGDPAREVRRPTRELPWDQSLVWHEGTYTLTITAQRDGQWGSKPIIHFLPHRIRDAHVTHGEEIAPTITDNFILVPVSGTFEKGDEVRIVFAAERVETERTSAAAPPIVADKAATSRPTGKKTQSVRLPSGVPVRYREGVARALSEAGENAAQLIKAIGGAREGRRPAVCFLIANMPARDAQSLSAEYLLSNVNEAYRARAKMPWGEDIPDKLFLNYVLPYACVTERRDAWRADFFERFAPAVADCKSMAEAAAVLNGTIYDALGVKYHASKRPRPDQSPYESIEAGFASCTGLSILLVDACRSVCIPSRFVGTPQWVSQSGNHSWVEVWDGQWAYLGAAEPDPRGVNHAWFADAAAKAKPGSRMHAIYAASFRQTDTHFPLVWNLSRQDVPAIDITRRYSDAVDVRVAASDRAASDSPVAGRLVISWYDEPYAIADLAGLPESEGEFRLPRSTPLVAVFERTDGKSVHRNLRIDEGDDTTIVIDASDHAADARRYRCIFSPEAPKIDGRLDDVVWQSAAWSEQFVDIRGPDHPEPRHETRLKMLWDDKHLYVAAKLVEPHVWATLQQRDAVVWYDNDFEIFIDPDDDGREYYEIEINALNTVFDLFLVRTYENGGPALHDWDMRGLRTAVDIRGTLNDPSDEDDGWSVECALPWRSLAEASRVPAPPRDGDVWRMNFSRVQWPVIVEDGEYQKVADAREDNWVWSPQGVINMHRPATWGRVVFERAEDQRRPK